MLLTPLGNYSSKPLDRGGPTGRPDAFLASHRGSGPENSARESRGYRTKLLCPIPDGFHHIRHLAVRLGEHAIGDHPAAYYSVFVLLAVLRD